MSNIYQLPEEIKQEFRVDGQGKVTVSIRLPLSPTQLGKQLGERLGTQTFTPQKINQFLIQLQQYLF